MKRMLFSVCVALAVLGCGGDDGGLPPCLTCTLCGSHTWNSYTEFCSEGTVYKKCGGSGYNPSTEFCSGGMVYSVGSKCGGSNYNTSTQFCSDSTVYSKCGGSDYSPSTQFCSNGTTVKAYGSITYQGQTYKTVAIGTQTWMAENLNYVVEGSKCYNNSSDNCDKYGSLYNWATAMALPSSCNSSTCSSQIQSPHRGICPSGWHLPSDAEWTTLTDYVGGYKTAGTKLKATSGWNNYNGVSGNGTDEYGFSALPGGAGHSDGIFFNVGYGGFWWSATEDGARLAYNLAYNRRMYYDYSYVGWDSYNTSAGLFSVRCLQD